MNRCVTLAVCLVGLAGCEAEEKGETQAEPQDVTLQFRAAIGGEDVACGAAYAIGAAETSVMIGDARLYVSAIQLHDAEAGWVDLALEQDGMWQHEGVALLDFEDGTASCADSGNAELRSVVTGSVPAGNWDGLRFDLGVPEALNHADSATSPSPLNVPGMFWVWQSGYKFARVDFVVAGETPSRWNVHLGSTGCASAAPTVAPDAPCTSPNRATITLEDFDASADVIALDLGALVAGADLTANTPDTPPGCMSSPTEPGDCGPSFEAVGLDFTTGACVADCASQTAFVVAAN